MACRKLKELNSPRTINKKIIENKKKILLAEGQKRTYVGNLEQQEKQQTTAINELKKDIKQLTAKLKYLNSSNSIRKTAEFEDKKITYPPGAKSSEDALTIYTLKEINATKQLDLLSAKIVKKQLFHRNVVEKYNEIVKCSVVDIHHIAEKDKPASIVGGDSQKLICHLENEIQHMHIQWMGAEHIRKKYQTIHGTLTGDSEIFEISLLKLEQSLTDQQSEINKMQQMNREALEMRDTTKVSLLKQEHTAHSLAKARERQASNFRRQVDERRYELERLERKLFANNKPLLHHDSIDSLNDPMSSNKLETERTDHSESSEMNAQFKILIEVTGATTPAEVHDRFLNQKDSAMRLKYLRLVAEREKKHLESKRGELQTELEAAKFSSVRENDINLEQVETIKTNIEAEESKIQNYQQGINRTKAAIESIRHNLFDSLMKLKLQLIEFETVDQSSGRLLETVTYEQVCNYDKVSDVELVQLLVDLLTKGQQLTRQPDNKNRDLHLPEDELTLLKMDDLHVPLSSRSQSPVLSPKSIVQPPDELIECPRMYPECYSNLLAGRSTGQTISTTPGSSNQQVIASDDEGEVPTRGYIKRQSQIVVDSKLRRKGFRPPAQRR